MRAFIAVDILLVGIDRLQTILRPLLLATAGLLAVVATADWAVRTRRLNPFGSIGRFMRQRVDPLLAPVERRVVRAGGLPHHAPFWAAGAVVLVGILLLGSLDVARDMIRTTDASIARGPRGVLSLIGRWVLGLLRLALIVRVIGSWFWHPFSRVMRLATRLTEPLLAPVRRLLPVARGIDFSPLVVWFLLGVAGALLP